MTTSCSDITARLTPFLDGELPADDARQVESHLEGCVRCRTRAAAERATRDLLHARRAGLTRDTAPAALRARLADAARAARQPAVRPTLIARIGRAPLAAAATLALVLGGWTLHVATGKSNTLLAAQLAADHTKCHLFETQKNGLDPGHVHEDLKARYGFDAQIPGSSPDRRLRLVGARRCLTGEGTNAHILYRYDGRPVSLYLVPEGQHPSGEVDVAGHHASLWSRHNGTYVLVADAALTDLGRLASYMQEATE